MRFCMHGSSVIYLRSFCALPLRIVVCRGGMAAKSQSLLHENLERQPSAIPARDARVVVHRGMTHGHNREHREAGARLRQCVKCRPSRDGCAVDELCRGRFLHHEPCIYAGRINAARSVPICACHVCFNASRTAAGNSSPTSPSSRKVTLPSLSCSVAPRLMMMYGTARCAAINGNDAAG